MSNEKRYTINAPRVVHEIMDGEVVAIDLDTGSYYATNSIGTAIWKLLANQPTLDEATASMSALFDGDAQEIRQSVSDFLAELLTQELIQTVSTAAAPTMSATVDEAKQPFAKPTFEKFDDMQMLLQADPVHDVEDIKWPSGDPA